MKVKPGFWENQSKGIVKVKEHGNRRKKTLLACAVSVALLLSAVPAFARFIDGVVALVNNEPITYSEVRDEVASGLGIPVGDADVFLREQKDTDAVLRWVNALVEVNLVRAELKKKNQAISDKEVDRVIENVKQANKMDDAQFAEVLLREGSSLAAYRSRVRVQLERGAIVRERKFKEVNVTEDEVRDYFRANSERFVEGGEIRIEALFFPLPPAGSGPEDSAIRARYAAYQAVSAVGQKRSLMEGLEVARALYPETEAANGDFSPVEDLLPEIRREAERLYTGERSEPFPTETGVYIIRVVGRRGGNPLEFSQVKDALSEELADRRSSKALVDIIEDLKKSASIDVRL